MQDKTNDSTQTSVITAVLEDGVDKLQHRRDPSASSNHANGLLHVPCVGKLCKWALHFDFVADFQVCKVPTRRKGKSRKDYREASTRRGTPSLAHHAGRVILDQQVEVTQGTLRRDGRVRPGHHLAWRHNRESGHTSAQIEGEIKKTLPSISAFVTKQEVTVSPRVW